MESQSRRRGAILPATALVTALFAGSCAEPSAESQPSAGLATATQRIEPAEFDVSGPFTHKNLEVFLVHSRDQRTPERPILTLEEALEQKLVTVHETGNVQELSIENNSDTDVFVQSGDIVQGGKQDRVLSKDLLLKPKSGRVPLASFCVEQGRWGVRTGNWDGLQVQGVFSAGSSTDLDSAFATSRNALSSKELKRAVRVANDQQAVWQKVSVAQAQLSANIGSSVNSALSETSLELTLGSEKVQKATAEYEDALESIPEDKRDVVGFAFAINGEINSAEVYATNDLFRRIWKKSLQACAVEAVSIANEKKNDVKPTSLATVKAFLSVPQTTTVHNAPLGDRQQFVTVDSEKVVFSETRDGTASSAWIHRSYLAK